MTLEEISKHKKVCDAVTKTLESWDHKKSQSQYDKMDASFNGDSRHKVFEIKDLYFSSYSGVYGDSNCGTHGNIGDEKIFKRLFIEYLSMHWRTIFSAIAKQANAIVAGEKQQLVDSYQAKIDELEQYSVEEDA